MVVQGSKSPGATWVRRRSALGEDALRRSYFPDNWNPSGARDAKIRSHFGCWNSKIGPSGTAEMRKLAEKFRQAYGGDGF